MDSGWPPDDALPGEFSKRPMLLKWKHCSDERWVQKLGVRALQLRMYELNENEPMMKPRKGKTERKSGGYVCTREQRKRCRMTACVSPGVKLARHPFRRHSGTSEVIVTSPNPFHKGGNEHSGCGCNDGGRPACSSVEAAVMAVERRSRHVCVSWPFYNRKTG